MGTRPNKRPIRHATEDMLELPPMLSAEASAVAWLAFHTARDAGDHAGAVAARNLIVEANLRLVPFTLNRYSGLARMHKSPEDAFQLGAMGLVAAVQSFDPNGGSVFSTYAIACIRNEVRNGRDARGRVGPRAWAIMQGKSTAFYAEHGYNPNEEELLEITGLSADHLRFGLAWGRKQRAMSLDAPMGDPDDSEHLAELAADKKAVGPCDFLRQAEADAFLRRIMVGLKPIYRKLLWLRFAAGWSLPALGKLCNTSRQRIEQIVQAAVGKLQRVYTRAYRIWAGLEVPTCEQGEIMSRWLRNG